MLASIGNITITNVFICWSEVGYSVVKSVYESVFLG